MLLVIAAQCPLMEGYSTLDEGNGVWRQATGYRLQVTEKGGLQSKRLTASLFIKRKKFMEKRKKLIVVLINKARHITQMHMVKCR